MCLAVLNTDSLGLCGVPRTLVRTLFFLFSRASALLSVVIRLTLFVFPVVSILLGPGFPGLPANHFVNVLDSLPFVGLRLFEPANGGRGPAEEFLVNAPESDPGFFDL